MANEKTEFYYWGDGEYIAGVPARDLTERDLAGLSPVQRRDMENAEIVRWSGNTRKTYRLYGKTARPGNLAKAMVPADVAKVRAAEEAAALEAAQEAAEELAENSEP